jgi:uncharacterized protein involved in exopolysaccharide biosynthesis
MSHSTIHPRDVLNAVRKHKLLLIAPIVLCTSAAVVVALLRPATWEASQALVVRSETGETTAKLGRATQLEDMKSTQETILEFAKSRAVLMKALAQVGPGPNDKQTDNWPTEAALEGLQDAVSLSPPKGAEFGKTELFYLKVKDHDRARAIALATAICSQLQERLAALQAETSRGSIDELTQSASLARKELDKATAALGAMEQNVGNDLAELRILSDSPSGDSDLRRNLVELEKELRGYKATQVENEESLKLLQEAQASPEKLLAAPSLLLKSQPALGRLKDGLVDAQLRSGQALGTMSEDHPMVRGARESERVIRQQLYGEIGIAIQGVQADLKVGADRIQLLEQQVSAIQQRLTKLIDLRVQYANLADAVKNRSETLKTVEHELADARARNAAALATTRLNLVDKPDAGTRPIGPGRSMIAAGGLGGGLLISAAILFLLINPAPVHKPAIAEEQPVSASQEQPGPQTLVLAATPDTVTPEIGVPETAKPAPTGKLTLGKALQRVAG